MRNSITCILVLFSLYCQAQVFAFHKPTDSISIVYQDQSFNKKKKAREVRIQLLDNSTSGKALLMVNNIYKMPSSFKHFKISGAPPKVSFSKKQALRNALPLIDSQAAFLAKDTLFFTDPREVAYLKKGLAHRNAERYFHGKNAGRFYKNSWVPLYSLQAADSNEPLTLDIRGTFFKKARYKTGRLPIASAYRLPSLDTNPCQPFDRFHALREMNGYGIDKFKYIRYRPSKRQNIRKQFEIYFDKNSANATEESLAAVVEYLQNNNYSILNATIEGYSSIEGKTEENKTLQYLRAKVLLQALQKHNREPIQSDTLIIKPGHELFRKSIVYTPYAWLDSLSDERLEQTINTNKDLLIAIEPYLKSHRKAVLKLVVAKQLEGADLLRRVREDFTEWEIQLNSVRNQGTTSSEVEARLMGLNKYLMDLLDNEMISSHDFAQIYDGAFNADQVKVLLVYHKIIEFENSSKKDSLGWDAYSTNNQFNEFFLVAQSDLIRLIQNPDYSRQQDKFKRQLVDIQTYTFEYARKGWLSMNALCQLDFPDKPVFRGYKLNHLAFLQMMNEITNVPCEPLRLTRAEDPEPYDDAWLDEMRKERGAKGIVPVLTTDGRHRPIFGKKIESPLMFYLKMLFLNKETSIQQYVITSDSYHEFDLYTLARYHVSQWDPNINYFEDPEVQLLEMDRLIGKLKAVDKRICKYQLSQLYLDYHLKSLHYLQQYFQPGNAQQVKVAQRSMKYISQYYSDRSFMVTPKLSLYVIYQLNAFQNMPGEYPGSWYAWQLLKAVNSHRMLTYNELMLWNKYKLIFEVPNNDEL